MYYGLKEYAENTIAMPTDLQHLTTYKKENVEAKRIILDGVKDHIFPHIAEKDKVK